MINQERNYNNFTNPGGGRINQPFDPGRIERPLDAQVNFLVSLLHVISIILRSFANMFSPPDQRKEIFPDYRK